MRDSETQKTLRSQVIDFLNQPVEERKKSTFNPNQQLTPQQKMLILKRITSESDKFSLNLTHSVKNYQKAAFLPPHLNDSLSNSSQIINNSQVQQNQVTAKNMNIKEVEDEYDQSATAQTIMSQRDSSSYSSPKLIPYSSKKKLSTLAFESNTQKYIQKKNQLHPLQELQTERNKNKFIPAIYDLSQDNIQAGQRVKTEGHQEIKPFQSQIQNARINSPLILSQEYKDLFKKQGQKISSRMKGDDNSIESSTLSSTSRGTSSKSNCLLFNSIRYLPINRTSAQQDLFTDDETDTFAATSKKRDIYEIMKTKISLITPPSKLHTLVKRNNSYFFEKSPQYKRQFYITPQRNNYLRQDAQKQNTDVNLLIKNKFYDAKNPYPQQSHDEVENDEELDDDDQKEITDKHKVKSKQCMINIQKASSNPFPELDYQQNLQKNNTTTTLQSKMNPNKLNHNEYYDQSTSLQVISCSSKQKIELTNYSSINTSLLVPLVGQQDSQTARQEETLKERMQEEALSSNKKSFQSNRQIPKFEPIPADVLGRANKLINNNKMFSPSSVDLMQNLRKINPKQRESKFNREGDSKRGSIRIKHFGDFEYEQGNEKITFNKFSYNIGEREKNIQNIIDDHHHPNSSLFSNNQKKKSILPKVKIVNNKNQSLDYPAPGYYNVNTSSIQSRKGHTISKTKKQNTFSQKIPLCLDKQYTPINERKIVDTNKETTAEQYFNKLMNEVKREVDRETGKIGQVFLRADSIQELNSIEQVVIDRYSNDLTQKLRQCKHHLNNIKNSLKRDDSFFAQ